ncbi:MAG TPA: hypothetical protein VMN60_13895 [Longimicrobiales bacterium]|nr:hypothetical protein [Longimicrobiales bacterium]
MTTRVKCPGDPLSDTPVAGSSLVRTEAVAQQLRRIAQVDKPGQSLTWSCDSYEGQRVPRDREIGSSQPLAPVVLN